MKKDKLDFPLEQNLLLINYKPLSSKPENHPNASMDQRGIAPRIDNLLAVKSFPHHLKPLDPLSQNSVAFGRSFLI
jgi:hypothetical protein